MSDSKKAALHLAKLEAQVEEAGMNISDRGGHRHEIEGTLDGAHTINAHHDMLNTTDFFDFHIVGGHDFNLTVSGFNPQWSNTALTNGQLQSDPVHDLLKLDWDRSSGVTDHAQELAALTTHVQGHDVVLDIHTSTVDGTITFKGLADLASPGADHFGWVDVFHPEPAHAV